jgi:hypothetical protein
MFFWKAHQKRRFSLFNQACNQVLADLGHSGHSHDGRFPLPGSKCTRFLAVSVAAGKHFAVFLENLRFIMMVFAPSVSGAV